MLASEKGNRLTILIFFSRQIGLSPPGLPKTERFLYRGKIPLALPSPPPPQPIPIMLSDRCRNSAEEIAYYVIWEGLQLQDLFGVL